MGDTETHWHLFEETHHPGSKQRFAGETGDRLQSPEHAVAYTPQQAVDWVAERERAHWVNVPDSIRGGQLHNEPGIDVWLVAARLRTLQAGKAVAGGVRLSRTRVVDLWAIPVPLSACPRHQQPPQ